MKFLFAAIFLFFTSVLSAQDFNTQIYFEHRTDHWNPHEGTIANINDSLAYLRFSGPWLKDNAYFACKHYFRNDSLFLDEIIESIDLNKRYELRNKSSSNIDNENLYLTYQVYNESGGQPAYNNLFFEVDGNKYPNTKECDSHCGIIKRPKAKSFILNIWDAERLLDSYALNVTAETHSVYLTKDIFKSNIGFNSFEEIEEKIPNKIEIYGKAYFLITELKYKSFPLFIISDSTLFYEDQSAKK